MPELGKATYELILTTKQFDRGMANAETRAAAATSKIAKSMGMTESAVASIGPAAEGAAVQVGAAGTKAQAGFQKFATGAEVAAAEVGAASTQMAATTEAAASRGGAAWTRFGNSARNAAESTKRALGLAGLAAAYGVFYVVKSRKVGKVSARALAAARMVKAIDAADTGDGSPGDIIKKAVSANVGVGTELEKTIDEIIAEAGA